MKHEMSDEEYGKYLDDMTELAKFRRIKSDFPRVARSWYEGIQFWFGEGKPLPAESLLSCLSSCAREDCKYGGYYCDHCPFPGIFGCPFGYEVSYSK
jgi:hypothetical protein